MSEPLISLVLIVRDEQELLSRLLVHHRALYDEAIVVDTGSIDGTREAAATLDARVVKFEWRDDFAAARNAGLCAAHGRWILCLDADELIACRDLDRVRGAVTTDPTPRGFFFSFRSYTTVKEHLEWQPVRGDYPEHESGQEGFIECVNLRLFPRRPDLRFHGRVHESVEPDAVRIGLPLIGSDVPIHHYGLVREPGIMAAKRELYARLVPQKWREHPAQTGARLELACRLIGTGESATACRLLEELADTEPADAHVQRARLYLARARWRLGDLSEAQKLLMAVVAANPEWLQGWVELARLLAAQNRWSELAGQLRRARLAVGEQPLLLREECVLLAATGRLVAAERTAKRLTEMAPAWEEGRALARQLAQAVARATTVGPTTPEGRRRT